MNETEVTKLVRNLVCFLTLLSMYLQDKFKNQVQKSISCDTDFKNQVKIDRRL